MSSKEDIYPSLSDELCENLYTKFQENPTNIFAQNICTRNDPIDILISHCRIQETQNVFSHKIEDEGKPVTNQKSTGRCWMFGGLNIIRLPFIKEYELEDFEFSQAYLFFWQKVEKSYFYLNKFVEAARRKEPLNGRRMCTLLASPVADGGKWELLVDLINKYGLMPKKNFPETFSSENSYNLNTILKSKLREFSMVLSKMVEDGKSDDEVKAKIEEQMAVVYRIVAICVGVPQKKFTWEYTDKSKTYHSIGPITPKEFYETHVKPLYNINDKVRLNNDPRSTVKYNQAYAVEDLHRITIGGHEMIYNNQPMELLVDLCVQSIKNNEPVWFTYDSSQRNFGAMYDLEVYDSTSALGVDFFAQMTKAERLLYYESMACHCAILTAVSLDDDEKPTKWRFESSWGSDSGDQGYFLMTNDWFKEFVYEVVVDKSIVPKEVMEVFEMEPVILPLWDPMS